MTRLVSVLPASSCTPDADEVPSWLRPASTPSRPAAPGLSEIAAHYGKYVALFVGAGLISGAVVHFPLAPTRYGVIGATGATLFAVASVLSEGRGRSAGQVVRIAMAALALALGIGMISGSIQHFQDIPDRAAVLIPLGVLLSSVAFVVRHDLRVRADQLVLSAGVVTALAAVLFIGLAQAADRVATPAADHHSTASTTGHDKAVPDPANAHDDAPPAAEHATGSARRTKRSKSPTSTGAAAPPVKNAHAADGHGH